MRPPEDIGLAQQVELYDELAEATGAPPPVIDGPISCVTPRLPARDMRVARIAFTERC